MPWRDLCDGLKDRLNVRRFALPVILARASQGRRPEEASCEDPLLGPHGTQPWMLGTRPRA